MSSAAGGRAPSTERVTVPTPDAMIGRVLQGAFRIERRLGSGAMGTVYAATQLSLGKLVAIKVLREHLRQDPQVVRRFHREARAASALEHPNSVRVVDFGETPEGDLYIAMELLDGRELARVIDEEWPFPLPRLVHVMSQVLGVLGAAHRRGIVHRDLKPENVMLLRTDDDPDYVKVCDFGIAKLLDGERTASALTELGVVCGTPEYMSPEQARGETLDGRSDIYAAGVMLYRLATRRLPFTAETAIGVVTKQITEEPTPPSELVAMDPRLEALILRALEKRREGRFQSAEDLKRGLAELLEPGDQTTARVQRVPPPRPRWLAGMLLAITGAIGAAGIVALRARAKPAPVTVAARVVPLPPAPPAATLDELEPRPAPDPGLPPVPVGAVAPPPRERPRRETPLRDVVARPPVAAEPAERERVVEAPRPPVTPPSGWQSLLADATKALSRGQVDDAIAKLEEASRAPGHPPRVWRELGRAYGLKGDARSSRRMDAAYERYCSLATTAQKELICVELASRRP